MTAENLQEIFKAYDVRGKVGTELTAEVANVIGKAFAQWLPEPGAVAVGRDMRPDSAELATALIDGLRDQGRDVWDIGEVTSDMIYFAAGNYDLAGGVMITASHNPGIYNGIKFCREAAKAVGEDSGLFEVRDLAAANDFSSVDQSGSLTPKDIAEAWIEHTLSFIKPDQLKPLHIAVDAGNGMAGKIFPELEPFVPFTVEELYFELDGTFPNHEANPLKFETLKDLTRVINDKKCDAGIAFDGDGDRAFLLDDKGQVLSGGVMSAILADYFLDEFPGSNIVYDARNSRVVPDIISKKGGTAVRSRVGHSFIKQVMRQSDAPFGGELSGHFYFRDNWYADSGLIAAVMGLYLLSLSGKKLSELRQQYEYYASLPETNFVVHDKTGTMQLIAKAFSEHEPDWLDGLTITLPHGWFNVRPSNTESVLRVNAEAKNQSELDSIVAKVTELIAVD